MAKVGLISLGCAKNFVDSEAILGMLDKAKFEVSYNLAEADLIIINTCGFILASKKESIGAILDAEKYHVPLVVVGCLVERYYEELKKELPEVALFVPIREYPKLNEYLEKLLKVKEIAKFDPSSRLLGTPFYSAFLRIGDGCDHFCAFCAIPLIRGHLKSRPINEIIKEAYILKNKGIIEVTLLAQDTSAYGLDFKDGTNLAKLLKELLKVGFYSIRLLYLYPSEIDDELLTLFKNNKSLMPYFDLPLQHSESKILKSMLRKGDAESYLKLIQKIRETVKNAIIRTTLIVGFPGESDEDFNNLLDFIKLAKFDHVGAFKYSREEGTASFNYPNQIPSTIKTKRYRTLMKLQKSISYEQNKTHLGEVMEGIVIGKDDNHYYLRSYWNAPENVDGDIIFKSNKELEIGSIVHVKITNVGIYDLMGQISE